jgi:lactate dehydrogenase-like 2-hydroxyacid dehydrogenase
MRFSDGVKGWKDVREAYKIVSFYRAYPPETQMGWFKDYPELSIDLRIVPKGCSTDEICNMVQDADIVLQVPGTMLTREILENMGNVKLLQFLSIGYDTVDLKAASELGITVANNPGFCAIPVAEHAIMAMLTLMRWGAYSHMELVKGNWVQKEIGFKIGELNGKTVGILGLGSIGTEVAKRLRGFNVRILYNKRNRLDEATEKELGVEYGSLDQLIEESDVLTIHVPLTDETRGLIGRDEIARMKKGAIIINTARGPIVDEAALAEALKEERLLGAAIDVPRYGEGELPQLVSMFQGIKNVLLTPHVSAFSPEAEIRWAKQFSENVFRVLRGETANYVVN